MPEVIDASDYPHPSADSLVSHQELEYQLSQWAGVAHRLVRERIDALAAAYGRDYPGSETTEEFVARVHAGGQHPFPRGVSNYEDLNDNRGYDWHRVSYGRVFYGGHYPEWNADGSDYITRWAEIDVPSWLITEPDGVERYRRETEEAVAKLLDEEAELNRKVKAAVDQARAEMGR